MIAVSAYYFLFGLAGVAVVAATVQDLRRSEIANWLNFSFLAFALAYRAFYSAGNGDWMFLVYGIAGALLFYGIGNLLYYSRMYGGGDVKLLMGFGAVLPYSSWNDLIIVGLGFIFILFLVGVVYTLAYSIWIAVKNKRKFVLEFGRRWEKAIWNNKWFYIAFAFVILFSLMAGGWLFGIFGLAVLTYLLFIYIHAVDRCMIKLKNPLELQEGDWLEEEVKLARGKVIEKSVHGLSFSDIRKLKKARKKVLIKEGIPFTPAFLIAWVIMVFVYFF